jgi:hypothetical protein
MAKKFCSQCGAAVTDAAKYCHSCGSSLSEQVPVPSEPRPSGEERTKKKEPGLSFPPSNEEYAEAEFWEAAAIWNNMTVWQRRIWNEAGRPDLLTYPGSDFGEWIIDNADDTFNFDEFVEDWGSRSKAEVGIESQELGPLAASSWVLGVGLIVGLLATLFGESNSSFLSFTGNFASATFGWGIVALIALAISYGLAPSKRAVLRRQMVGLAGWVGISFTSGLLILIVALAM